MAGRRFLRRGRHHRVRGWCCAVSKGRALERLRRRRLAHCKFIGYSAEVEPLLVKAGIADDLDAGCFALAKNGVADFVDALAELRFWNRELNVDLDAANNKTA